MFNVLLLYIINLIEAENPLNENKKNVDYLKNSSIRITLDFFRKNRIFTHKNGQKYDF